MYLFGLSFISFICKYPFSQFQLRGFLFVKIKKFCGKNFDTVDKTFYFVAFWHRNNILKQNICNVFYIVLKRNDSKNITLYSES